jgi:hypothetical protein
MSWSPGPARSARLVVEEGEGGGDEQGWAEDAVVGQAGQDRQHDPNLRLERWLVGGGQAQHGGGHRGRRAYLRLQRPQPDGHV